MNLRDMKYISVIAEEKSITKAAAKLSKRRFSREKGSPPASGRTAFFMAPFSAQVGLEETFQFAEWDPVGPVVQVDVFGVLHHVEFLGLGGLFIDGLAEELGMAGAHDAYGPGGDLVHVVSSLKFMKGSLLWS